MEEKSTEEVKLKKRSTEDTPNIIEIIATTENKIKQLNNKLIQLLSQQKKAIEEDNDSKEQELAT